MGVFDEYILSWRAVDRGRRLAPHELSRVLHSPEEYDQYLRMKADPAFALGAFNVCRPHADVMLDFLARALHHLVDSDADDLPPLQRRGQEFAWQWTYWGRAAVFMWEATGDARFLELFGTTGAAILGARTERRTRAGTLAGWADGKNVIEHTTTGLIALPFAHLARALGRDHACSQFARAACAIARDCVLSLEPTFVCVKGEAGHYRESVAWGRSSRPALNHQSAIGAACFALGWVLDDARLVERGKSLFAFFRQNISYTKEGRLWWPYQIRDRGPERMWKALVTLEMALAAYEFGQQISAKELKALGSAISIGGKSTIPCFIGGTMQDQTRGGTVDLSRPPDFSNVSHDLIRCISGSVLLDRSRDYFTTALARRMLEFPAWFPDGLLSGPAIGAMARAFTFRDATKWSRACLHAAR